MKSLSRLLPSILVLSLGMPGSGPGHGSLVAGVQRIADLNPGAVGSYPSNLATFNGSLYLSAYTFELGRELWKYDGATLTLTTNINETADDIGFGFLEGNGSDPVELTGYNGALHFAAFDPRRGGELWRYDGSHAVRVADINPDVNDTIKPNPNSSWPVHLTPFNSALYFAADTGILFPNYELWRYDGVTATLITNLHADLGTNNSSYPQGLTVFDQALYFMANDGLAGYELWKLSGTTLTLLDIHPGGPASDSFPKNFTPLGNALYFQAFHPDSGYELWKTDGGQPTLVHDLNPAGESSFPDYLTPFNGALYFRATDAARGSELWKCDGTNITPAAEINPAGDSWPKNLTVFNGRLYFAADDGVNGWELWKFDGATAGMVTNLNAVGDAFPEFLTVAGDSLYFVATTPDTGYELWRYDGETVTLAGEANVGPGDSYPRFLTAYGNGLVFSATEDGTSNWEPWTFTTAIAPFRISEILREDAGVRLIWSTPGGTTNVVQSATDDPRGPYQDLSGPIVVPGAAAAITNYLDTTLPAGPATRFYRIARP